MMPRPAVWLLLILYTALLAGLAPSRVEASEYTARVVRVIDGDTFVAEVAVWPRMTWTGSVRVRGVDTPELRGQCEREKRLARRARDLAAQWLLGADVTLSDVVEGTFRGRIVATVTAADEDLADVLLAAGVAVRMKGRKRTEDWCE